MAKDEIAIDRICGIFGGGFYWWFGESCKCRQIKCMPFRL